MSIKHLKHLSHFSNAYIELHSMLLAKGPKVPLFRIAVQLIPNALQAYEIPSLPPYWPVVILCCVRSMKDCGLYRSIISQMPHATITPRRCSNHLGDLEFDPIERYFDRRTRLRQRTGTTTQLARTGEGVGPPWWRVDDDVKLARCSRSI